MEPNNLLLLVETLIKKAKDSDVKFKVSNILNQLCVRAFKWISIVQLQMRMGL